MRLWHNSLRLCHLSILKNNFLNTRKMPTNKCPLVFNILSECKTTKGRVGKVTLPHGDVDTPVFMPVGTQVCYKYFCFTKVK